MRGLVSGSDQKKNTTEGRQEWKRVVAKRKVLRDLCRKINNGART